MENGAKSTDRNIDEALDRVLPGNLKEQYYRALEEYDAEVREKIESARRVCQQLINDALDRMGISGWARPAHLPRAMEVTRAEREAVDEELGEFLRHAWERFNRRANALLGKAEDARL